MASSPQQPLPTPGEAERVMAIPRRPFNIARWLTLYGVYLLALIGTAGWMLQSHPHQLHKLFSLSARTQAVSTLPATASSHGGRSSTTSPTQKLTIPKFLGELSERVAQLKPVELKIVIFAIYMSVSMTFLPLNTLAMVGLLAMPESGVAGNVWATTALIACIGGFGSMMANIADYGLLRLVLRQPRIARIKNIRLYKWAERLFERQPFELLLFFNIVPFPVDVARLLAAAESYHIGYFALASFVGRGIRYSIIAFITYELGERAWISPLVLVGVAVLMPLEGFVRKLIAKVVRKKRDTKQQKSGTSL